MNSIRFPSFSTLSLWLLLSSTGSVVHASEPPAQPPASDLSDAVPQEVSQAQLPSAVDLLAGIDARVEALGPFRYGVVRSTEQKGARIEERWRFVSGGDGRFRIDYSGDTQRQIVCDGHILWDYIPSAKMARKIDLSAIGDEERRQMLGRVMQKTSIPGLRAGVAAAGMEWEYAAGAVGGDEPIVVYGIDEKGGEITMTLDAQGRYLLRSEIRQDGRFVVSIDADQHTEAKTGSGVFFPGHVEMIAADDAGETRVSMKITQIVAGEEYPITLFQLQLDPSVSVETVP